uniref:Uncharacterized protein n=1 Tax=Anguilla anguilla TaxID=7936 RepID=A0A0E9SHN0_ANGAN
MRKKVGAKPFGPSRGSRGPRNHNTANDI